MNGYCLFVPICVDIEAKAFQAINHDSGIITVERTGYLTYSMS
jgi:hypothetical protein